MKVYMGSGEENLKIQPWKLSRYGFSALFLTTDISLARLFAQYNAELEYKFKGGFVYEFHLTGPFHEINYNGKVSYSTNFRNLMFELSRQNHSVVIMQDVLDWPSERFMQPTLSDIAIVYDFSAIESFKLIEKNVVVI